MGVDLGSPDLWLNNYSGCKAGWTIPYIPSHLRSASAYRDC